MLDERGEMLLSSVVPSNNPTSSKEFLQHFVESNADCHLILIQQKSISKEELLALRGIITSNPSKLITLVLSEHQSAGEGRNIGISMAVSEWIAFHDCDDLPNFENLTTMIKHASLRDSCLAAGEYLENTILDGIKLRSKKVGTDYISLIRKPGIWRFAFKRSLIGESRFHPRKLGEDLEFMSNLNFRVDMIYRSSEIVYIYNYERFVKGKKKYSNVSRNQTGLTGLRSNVGQQILKSNLFQASFALYHSLRLFWVTR
jgi:glycosyltransferase involved in cell wall biosynthesis